MPDVFDLTEQYRSQLMKREDKARLSMLKEYRGVWGGLDKKIESTAKRIEFSEGEVADLAEAFKDEIGASVGSDKPAELSVDKLSKFTDLLLKKNSWQELERSLDGDFRSVADMTAEVTEDHRKALGQTAVDHAVKLMQAQLGKDKTRRLPKEELEALNKKVKADVEEMWQTQRDDLREIFRAKAAEVSQRAREALRQEVLHGLLINAGAKQILSRVKLAIEDRAAHPEKDPVLVRALQSEYRIATQNSYRESMRMAFTESGRVSGWRWTLARTPATCAVCWAMDGKIFPLETPLKSHPHCRCVPVPVVENLPEKALPSESKTGESETNENGENGESETGGREGGETGEVAFSNIPPSQQKAILGMKAFDAYERGEFDLSDLVGVQFNTRFGVMLYRKSVDSILNKSESEIAFAAASTSAASASAAASAENPNEERLNSFLSGQEARIDPANFIAANFSPFSQGTSWLQSQSQMQDRQGADTFVGGSLNFGGSGGSLSGPGGKKKAKPKFRKYGGGGVSATVQKGQTQFQFYKNLLTAHGRFAGLRGNDLTNFVDFWTKSLDPATFEMVYYKTDNKVGKAFKVGVKFSYHLNEDILKDLQERQEEAHKNGRWRNESLAKETDGSDSGGSGNKNANGAKTGSTDAKPVPTSTVPTAEPPLGQQDVDDIYASLPTFGGGSMGSDGTFTISVNKSRAATLSDFFILGYFIQQKFGGEMWGDKVNEYATSAIQRGVKMQVVERDDDSDPRVYKLKFSAADLQKLARLKLEWDQEYMHQVLAQAKSREAVDNMFLDFLKMYPNLGVGFIEQLANIPVEILNQAGDPVSMIPGYKEARFLLGMLGYETPDFKLFEVPRISLDVLRLKYKSEMFQRDGAKIEQGTLFIINLILLKRALVGVPKGPLENPLGLRNAPTTPAGVPVVPKSEPVKPVEEPVAPKTTEPTKPVVEEPLPQKPATPKTETPLTEKPVTPKTETPVKTVRETPKTTTKTPTKNVPKVTRTPKVKPIPKKTVNPAQPKPLPKKAGSVKTSKITEPVTDAVKIPKTRKPINSQYAGKKFPLAEYAETMAKQNPARAKFYRDVAKKYPDSVKFTERGYPDFSPYSIKTVKLEGLTGKSGDFTMANKAAGFKETPKGYTWHHNQDGKTMELIPRDLHETVRHTGGASELKNSQ